MTRKGKPKERQRNKNKLPTPKTRGSPDPDPDMEMDNLGETCDPRKLFATIFVVRILSVIFATSEFVPDEGWQSIEVSRFVVYGEKSGYLTWEWVYGIRSFLYPLLFVPITCVLKFLYLDNQLFLMLFPRLFHAFLSGTGECCLIKYCQRKFGVGSARWVGHLLVTNWFLFFCASRTLTNNTEMALGLIALELFDMGCMSPFAACVGISFYLRPTSVLLWIPFSKVIIWKVTKNMKTFLQVVLVGITVITVNIWIDNIFYKEIVHPWWRFLQFNIFQGQSSQFGTHPFLWYIYSALPSIFGLNIIMVIFPMLTWMPRHFELNSLIFHYILVFSMISHKEIRFLMPIIPLCCAVAGDSWYMLLKHLKATGSRLQTWLKAILLINLFLNVGAAIIFSCQHQVGIKPATTFIGDNSRRVERPNIWVLMPCFSFPVHTYIGNPNARLEYFTCSPAGYEYDSPNVQRVDFANVNLTSFVEKKVNMKRIYPDYVLIYDHSKDVVLSALKTYVKVYSYKVCYDVLHTPFPFDNVGNRVQVICQYPLSIRNHKRR